jgi:hypothetical protein
MRNALPETRYGVRNVTRTTPLHATPLKPGDSTPSVDLIADVFLPSNVCVCRRKQCLGGTVTNASTTRTKVETESTPGDNCHAGASR